MSDPNAQPGAGWAPPAQPVETQPVATQPPSMGTTSPALGTWSSPTATTVMPVTPSGEGGGPRRSRGKTVGALVGVGALVAAGAFAVVTITSNDEQGGAASPSEVGTQLTAALDAEDVLGVIDLLLPGERDTFREPLIETFDNLRRLEILADDASLSGLSGIDVQFADVTVRERPTNVDDIVNIELSGSASVAIDGKAVPLGDSLIDSVFDGERPEMDAEPQSEEFQDVPMTVVERDGRWYLSAFYSAAEQARADTDLDIPATGVDAAGADDPEAAVDDMLEALSDQDLEVMIGLLDPTEAEALQRYAPLFLDDAQAELDDASITWAITDRTYSVSGSGSRRFVTLGSFTITASDGSTDVEVAYADGCITVQVDGDDMKMCTSDVGDLDQLLDDAGFDNTSEINDLVTTLQDAFDDYGPSGIAVHEVDGRWFLSPIRSYATGVNDVLDALDSTEIRDVIDGVQAVMDGLFESIDGYSVPGLDEEPVFDTATTVAFPSDTVPGDSAPDDTVADEFAALTDCYAELDAAAGIACMQAGIAAGTIDPTYVNPPLRFPECGVAELYWSEVYSLPDAEFAAMATGASQCFLDLVASKQIESWEIPNELLAPECLEGRNWFASTDGAYDDRFFDCVTARRVELGF